MSNNDLSIALQRWRFAEDSAKAATENAISRRTEFAEALDAAPEGLRMRELSGHSWRKNADESWTCSCTENAYTSSGLGLIEEMVHPPVSVIGEAAS